MTATSIDPDANANGPRGRPSSFTASDVATLRRAAEAIIVSDQTGDRVAAVRTAAALRDIAARIDREIARTGAG
ncbi:MAG TPA: hypothetical protein VF041_20655 [Gemmatimonadaceae bacterium]